MVRFLTVADLAKLVDLAKAALVAKGADFYGWKNAPYHRDTKFFQLRGPWGAEKEVEISADEALAINAAKLDGAYGERFLLTVGYIVAAVKKGVKVALLQVQEEPGLPFKADGWVVVSVEGYPLFHVAPHDLPLAEVAAAGLVSVIGKGTPEAQEHGWKGTDKVSEYSLLLDWMLAE